MIYKKLIFILAAIIYSAFAHAQKNCQDDIDKANKLFEDGIFRDAEKIAVKVYESCELDKTQENELLKLISSIYFELDELEIAYQYVAKFVKKNPYYIPSRKNDPFHFRDGIKKVKAWPQFSIGIRGGYPIGYVSTKKIYPILDVADYTQDYSIQPVFSSYFEFFWNINMFLSINSGVGIKMQNLTHSVPQFDQVVFDYNEQFMDISIPISVHLNLPINSRWVVSMFAGSEFKKYTGGKYSYSYSTDNVTDDRYLVYSNKKRDDVTVDNKYRNDLRVAGLAGIRAYYKLERVSFFADFRYSSDLNLFNNPDTRFDDQELVFLNNYNVSDIELENVEFSVGVQYNFMYRVKSKY